jgi:predicted DNA-binding protein
MQTQTYNVRLPAPLRARLTDEADRNGRVLSAEIRARLERSLETWCASGANTAGFVISAEPRP